MHVGLKMKYVNKTYTRHTYYNPNLLNLNDSDKSEV